MDYLSKIEKKQEVTKKDITQIIGLTNEVWQSWNYIFRSFWLTYYFGGETCIGNIHSNTLNISNFLDSDNESIAFAKIGKFNKPKMPYYAEKTWGSNEMLAKISSYYPSLARANLVGASLSSYGEYLNDLQKIRNTMIHLTEASFLDLKNYLISRNYTSPKNYYSHNHPLNFFYYKIGISPNLVYEDIFENLDSMIEAIFVYGPDI